MGIVITNGVQLNSLKMVAGNVPSPPATPTGLILNMDAVNYSGTGTSWPDTSGYSQNGTLQGNPTFNTNYFTFNGAGTQYVSFSNTSQIPTGSYSYTLLAWAKFAQLKQNGLIGWGTYNSNYNVNALRTSETSPGGLLNYWWGNDIYISNNMALNVWHHIIATYDKPTSTRKLWLNNTLIGTDYPSNSIMNTTPASSLTLARTWTGVNEYLNGGLSVARIYNRSLTSTEIATDYSSFRSRFPA